MRWKFTLQQDFGYGEINTVIDDPVGWADASFNITRDKEWHGVFFEYSASLKFYGEAYDLISAEYALNGVDGEMRLIIQFACSDTDPFEDFYTSKINFSKIEFDNSENCLVSVPIEDDTAFMLFKNRQDQKVDLLSLESFDGEDLEDYSLPLNINLAPKTFIIHDDLEHNSDDIHDWTDVVSVPASSTIFNIFSTRFFQLGYLDPELEEIGIITNLLTEYATDTEVLPILIIQRSGNYVFDIKISYDFAFGASGTALELADLSAAGFDQWAVKVVININGLDTVLDDTGTVFGYFPPNTSCDPPDSIVGIGLSSLSFSPTLAMNAGDEIKLFIRAAFGTSTLINPSGVPRDYNMCGRLNFLADSPFHNNYFKVTLATNNGNTPCDIILVNEALSRTAESITNDGLRVYSEYFGRTDSQPYSTVSDGDGSLEAITTGLAIRRWNVIKMLFSFKDLYDGLNAIHNIGMGLEDDNNYGRPADSQMLRIEPARYFYDDTVILVCDKIPNITRRVLSEEHYSIFEVGYAKWEAEEFNGLDEFATKREYRTTLKTIKNTLTKISNFIASGYAIELTKGKGHGTDDWRFDNDTFIICLLRSYGDFIVEQGNITSPANLIDPATVYNFRISPERNLLRWLMKVLASYVDPTTGELLFMDGSGNYLAEGLMPDLVEATVLSESESPVMDSTMADPAEGLPVYVPEQWVFDYPMSVDDYHTVKANPRGTIQVRWGQNTSFYNAYIRSIEYKPSKGKAQFTLLPKYPFAPIVDLDILLQENGDAILQESGGFIVLN